MCIQIKEPNSNLNYKNQKKFIDPLKKKKKKNLEAPIQSEVNDKSTCENEIFDVNSIV